MKHAEQYLYGTQRHYSMKHAEQYLYDTQRHYNMQSNTYMAPKGIIA